MVIILFALGSFKTSIISGCSGTALVTARPAAATMPDQNEALATNFRDGYRQLRMNPVITRRQAEQHKPIVNVKLSTEPGRQAVMLIVGMGGSRLLIMCENSVNATVEIPRLAATRGTYAAGVPCASIGWVIGKLAVPDEKSALALSFPFTSDFEAMVAIATVPTKILFEPIFAFPFTTKVAPGKYHSPTRILGD